MSTDQPPAPGPDGYSARVAELFATTPGAGRPPSAEGWVQAEARDPLTGTHVRWHLRDEAGRIGAALYEVRGCPHTVAVTAWIAATLPGQPASSAAAGIAAAAGALDVPPEKLGRLFVIEDALRKAALLLAAPRP